MAIFGEPLSVPRDADRDTMENLRSELEKRMRELTEEADNWWRKPEPSFPRKRESRNFNQ